jgi:hypothetical protein
LHALSDHSNEWGPSEKQLRNQFVQHPESLAEADSRPCPCRWSLSLFLALTAATGCWRCFLTLPRTPITAAAADSGR